MKTLRRWSRFLHRDIGYLFIGASLIYGLSGIALNHLNDWNPSYSVEVKTFETHLDLRKSDQVMEAIYRLLDEIDDRDNYKQHYYPGENTVKIFLKGGSNIVVNTETGNGIAEFLKRRPVFYEVNYLHYNPNYWWMWFSDIYAAGLIFLAITSFFIVKGKKGAAGRGAIYIAIGFIIPILFLIFLL